MKKLYMLLATFALVLSLTACKETEIEEPIIDDPIVDPDPEPEPEVIMVPLTSLEVLNKLFASTEVDMFAGIGIYGNNEQSLSNLERYLSDFSTGEGPTVTNLVNGAFASPMMSVDARGVMVIQLSDDSAHDELALAMENIASFRICVTIQEYQTAINGNYILFAGLDENQDFVDAFVAMDLEREIDQLTDETALSVLTMTYLNAESTMLSGAQVFSNDDNSMFEIEYKLNKDETIDLSNYVDAIQLQNNSYDQLVFMIHLSDNSNIDDIKTSFHSLADTFSWAGPIEDYKIVANGNYVLFAGADDSTELIKSFIELDL